MADRSVETKHGLEIAAAIMLTLKTLDTANNMLWYFCTSGSQFQHEYNLEDPSHSDNWPVDLWWNCIDQAVDDTKLIISMGDVC